MKQEFAVKETLKAGFTFGLISGVITTVGLMVGLHSGTHSKLAVMGGVLTIAIADAFSDALGVHVSEEYKNKSSAREVWEATLATLASKAVFALTFLVPVLLFDLGTAIIAAVVWGLSLICILSYAIARAVGEKPIKVVMEHLTIAVAVIVMTHYLGDWVAATFGEVR
jgi:VIT1/CCC1 family predicted Fe2+/Mn2+ transporter